MEVVRNFINIAGLADEDELLENSFGHIVQYAESDTIFIPENQPDVKSIFQVLIKVEIKSARSVNTPMGSTVVIDGNKKIKIIYAQNDNSGKGIFLDMETPYNTFVELPKGVTLEKVSVLVVDAYFSLLDKRKIYSHFVYMVNVSIGSLESHSFGASSSAKPNGTSYGTGDQEVSRINDRENALTKELAIELTPENQTEEILIYFGQDYY